MVYGLREYGQTMSGLNGSTEKKKPSSLWQPGQSGNPAGRPLGSKNHIVKLKQELEIAVRDNLDPKAIKKVLAKMVDMATEGNVGAAKLVLDKVLSNAKEAEDNENSSGNFVFQVKNLTLKHDPEDGKTVIDITPTTEET